MNVDELLKRVDPTRCRADNSGGYLMSCPCPNHGKGQGDRHASLSIRAGDSGGVLLYCHAGCKTEDVVAGFGLTMADLMGGDRRTEMPAPRKSLGKLAATYRYVDEEGNLLFEVIRYEPKDFRQRRPDGHGDWIWKLGDTRRVLYRLPELIAGVAAGEPVWVVEGEKDVDALVADGAVAACNPHGAGKWRPEYSEFLRGAEVIIVQDKDEPGRKHAKEVAASLEDVAASVRVVQAKIGKDASDHLAAAYGLEEFVPADEIDAPLPAVASTEAAAHESKREEGQSGLVLIPVATIVPEAVDWLWMNRIPRGKLCVIAGDPGLGKSYLSLTIAAVVSSGGSWPDGGRASAEHVLVVSAEDDPADTIRPRLDRLGADVTRISLVDGVKDDADVARPFSLRMDLALLRDAILDLQAALIIIDPLNAFLGGIDSHKAAEVRGVLSPLAHIASETHAAILAVHHLNKGTSSNALYRASGSLDFVAAARIVHGVAPDPDIEGRRVFVPVKCNIAAMPAGIGFRVDGSGLTFDKLPVTLDAAAAFTSRSVDHEERSERDMAKDFLVGELEAGPVMVVDLFKTAKNHGFAERTVRRAAHDLGIVKTKTGYLQGWQWSLPEPVGQPKMATDGEDVHDQNVTTFDIFGACSEDHVWCPSEDGEVLE